MKKKFKSILIGIILFTVTALITILTWLWQHNAKNVNPLPIPSNELELTKPLPEDNENTLIATDQSIDANELVIQVCASSQINEALETALVSFNQRYPRLQVNLTYSDSPQLINECPADEQDVLLFTHTLSTATLKKLTDATNISSPAKQTTDNHAQSNETDSAASISETRSNVRPFNYALFDGQRLEGAILSDKPGAISFRNFLLSSIGQDIFVDHGYDNIEGYNNRVDNLFNTNTNPPADTPAEKIAELTSQ